MAARPQRDVVVVGASAGGVEALRDVIGALPRGFPAAVLVVLHVSPVAPSVLPKILQRATQLQVSHAVDGDELERGRVYVAPPDHHLTVTEEGTLAVRRGPRENGYRPAVDALFRTAARVLGERVVGVVLTGALGDGTAGLAAIAGAGGIAVVQDPETALYPSMPRSALAATPATVLPLEGIGNYLATITNGRGAAEAPAEAGGVMTEADDSAQPTPVELGDDHEGSITGFTCPECNGTLWEVGEGGAVRLRCRVGHAYSPEGYASAHAEALEAGLWAAARALQEKAAFARRTAARLTRSGHTRSAHRFEAEADAADRLAQQLTHLVEQITAPLVPEEQVG